MMSESKTIGFLVAAASFVWTLPDSSAQGFGRGPHGKGQGHQAEGKTRPEDDPKGIPFGRMGGGPPGDTAFQADRSVFQFLLANHEKIRRQVSNLENGVETLTESDDPQIAEKIREHAHAMHKRVKSDRGIHLRDPLFAEIFRYTDRIDMAVGNTKNGVKVIETSDDPYVAKLIQAHAQVVSKFVASGHDEVRRNHEIPSRDMKPDEGSRAKNTEISPAKKTPAQERNGESSKADSCKSNCEDRHDASHASEGPGRTKADTNHCHAVTSDPKDIRNGNDSGRKPDSR